MRLLSRGPEDTFTYGFRLGSVLKKNDIVCLYGELGAGKTVFTKGIASALGISERDITSASFTIVAEYCGILRGEKINFYHIDLYRIEGTDQLDSAGIDEYIGRNGISVIEWAEKAGMVEDAVSVTFRVLGGEEREITIENIDEENRHYLQDRTA